MKSIIHPLKKEFKKLGRINKQLLFDDLTKREFNKVTWMTQFKVCWRLVLLSLFINYNIYLNNYLLDTAICFSLDWFVLMV